jgi:hypothetical protein
MPKYLKPRRPDSQIGICQRSGQKMYRSDMVEDGMVKGLLVHPGWWEEYHPQLLPPPMRPDGLPKRRPAPDDTFPMQASTLMLGGSPGATTLTWAPFGVVGSGSQIESYNVWRSTNSGDSFELIDTIPIVYSQSVNNAGVWVETFTYDQPFIDDASQVGYQYYVQGVQAHGQSAVTNTVTVPNNAATITITPASNPADEQLDFGFANVDGVSVFLLFSGQTGFPFEQGGIIRQFGLLNGFTGNLPGLPAAIWTQQTFQVSVAISFFSEFAPMPQNAFNTLAYMDGNGNPISLNTASATSFFQGESGGFYSCWVWEIAGTSQGMFPDGTEVVLTVT